jgi:outer membrane protein TolC
MKEKPSLGIPAALVFSISLMALPGCMTVGPDYKPPQTSTPTNWNTALAGVVTNTAVETVQLERWWTVFNDPLLSHLIEQARLGNLDLREAEARVRQAGAQRGIAKAGLFPTLNASASASRTTASKEAGNGLTSDFYSAGFDASWELDVFGGKRRSLESARGSLQA